MAKVLRYDTAAHCAKLGKEKQKLQVERERERETEREIKYVGTRQRERS